MPLSLTVTPRRRTPPAPLVAAHDPVQVRGALDHVSDAVLTADAAGCLRSANAAARALLALPPDAPLEGRTLDDALAPEAHSVFLGAREHAREVGAWTGDLVLRRANGEDCPVALTLIAQRDATGLPAGWAVVARELASPVRLRAVDAQARRYEGVGRLASGVAHDFQNLLAATLASSEHLLARFPAGSAERGDLEAIRSATERSARLVTQLLGYARRALDAPRACDINQSVRHVEDLLARVLTPSIALELDLAPVLPLIPVERTALEQGLLTLAVVVRDALPTGGLMAIRTDEVVHAPADLSRLVAPPGRYVALSVSARRAGAAPPAPGRRRDDTGLALASVTALVVQAGGFLWGESLPGREVTYTLWIPRADDDPATPPPG
ncbi:MAG: PAS domain-containing protein [Gemmatimonadetes bacterium]|nr:PAS domain-containing protein [Gemmatimonadota bacterium]